MKKALDSGLKTSKLQNSTKIDNTSGGEFEWKEKTDTNTRDIERLRNELLNERSNNIIVFGIFASLVTFFSVEIQVFKNIENFWLLLGLMSFFASSLLLFVFSLHSILRDRMRWKDFFQNPVFIIFLIFLTFSFLILLLNSKGINVELKVIG